MHSYRQFTAVSKDVTLNDSPIDWSCFVSIYTVSIYTGLTTQAHYTSSWQAFSSSVSAQVSILNRQGSLKTLASPKTPYQMHLYSSPLLSLEPRVHNGAGASHSGFLQQWNTYVYANPSNFYQTPFHGTKCLMQQKFLSVLYTFSCLIHLFTALQEVIDGLIFSYGIWALFIYPPPKLAV